MEPSNSEINIDILPPELWVAVFCHLNGSAVDIRSLAAASRSCRFFNAVIQDESIWRTISTLWDPWRDECEPEMESWRLTFQKQGPGNVTIVLLASLSLNLIFRIHHTTFEPVKPEFCCIWRKMEFSCFLYCFKIADN
jgi:hypothetical protein